MSYIQISRNDIGLDIHELLKCFYGSVFIAISSQLSVQTWPIPFTMQTLSILLTASVLGTRMGLYTVMLFLFEGAIGIPVFSGFYSGITRLLGPTGGYLIGFVPAVFFVGKLLEESESRGFWRVLWIGFIGEITIMICGFLHLANFVGFTNALAYGVTPFLLTDLFKLIMFVLLTYCSKTDGHLLKAARKVRI